MTSSRGGGAAAHKSQRFEIERLHRRLPAVRSAVSTAVATAFHQYTSPVVVFIDFFDETCVSPDSHNLEEAFEDQLK